LNSDFNNPVERRQGSRLKLSLLSVVHPDIPQPKSQRMNTLLQLVVQGDLRQDQRGADLMTLQDARYNLTMP
jgi:hypothetical protein